MLRDGDPGEPEQALGGVGNVYYSHAVEIEVYVETGEAAARDAAFDALVGRCHVNHRVTSLWAPTPEIMQRSSLAATVSSRRRGIGGVFGGRPDGVGR